MNRHIGVTATRNGLTLSQSRIAYTLLNNFDVLHHGDCVGGDATLALIARTLELNVISHPPSNSALRAYAIATETREPKPYLERNHDIVDESECLIAFPKSEGQEELRSGTWATVRYARLKHKPVAIVFPSGNVTYERWSNDVF